MECIFCGEELLLDEEHDSNDAPTKYAVCDLCYEDEAPRLVLAEYLELEDPSDLQDGYAAGYFRLGSKEYMCLTEDDADEKWDEALENYLDECVLSELPDTLHSYFDREKWKEDAKVDGRGHCLATYDGAEGEVEDRDGNYYFIYRTN